MDGRFESQRQKRAAFLLQSSTRAPSNNTVIFQIMSVWSFLISGPFLLFECTYKGYQIFLPMTSICGLFIWRIVQTIFRQPAQKYKLSIANSSVDLPFLY